MAFVPGFSNDVFISYSHLDNQAVGGQGWVSDFHQRLQVEIAEELGATAGVSSEIDTPTRIATVCLIIG